MPIKPPKHAAGVQYEPRSPASDYLNTPTTPEAKQTPVAVKKHAANGVRKLVRELQAVHPQIGDKELRDTLHKAVRAAIPLRRGRKEDPRITRGVELYLGHRPMDEVLCDVLGPRPPGGPADPHVWVWEKAAAATSKSIRRAARRWTKGVRRRAQPINKSRMGPP